MTNIFKIKREERWPALVALLVFVVLNSLLLYKYGSMFLKGHHVSYWQLFGRTFHVSGFDDWSYSLLSNGKLYYEILRHPLYGVILSPFYALNKWLISVGEINYAMIIMAMFLLVTAFYSFIFIYRIFREIIGISRTDTLLLTAFFFSFGMIMVSVLVPDHFCFSLFLLTMTLYLAGKAIRERRCMSAWLVTLLGFLTGGITLTNFAKTYLAAWFVNGGSIFRLKYVTTGVASLALLLLTAYLLRTEVREPQVQAEKQLAEKQYAKDPERARTDSIHHAKVMTHFEDEPAIEGIYTNLTISRADALVHNMFGESIQIHEDYLLDDMFNNRPEVVKYRHAFNYAVEAIIALLFVFASLVALRYKFFLMTLSWFAFDMVIHFGCGFGLDEMYIMATHWIFIIPIALAYLLRDLTNNMGQRILRCGILLITLYLWVWNGRLLVIFMTDQVTQPLKYFT